MHLASKLGVGAAAISAVVASIMACAQIAGIGDEPPTKLTCGALLGDGGCQTCGVSSCCLEMEACARSTSCRTLETCFVQCNGDPACRAQCATDHPVSHDPALSALTACLASKCDNACGPACGWFSDYVDPDAAPACQACAMAKSCQAIDDCFTSPTCAAVASCVNASVDLDTHEACLTAFGDAGAFSTVAAAIVGACGNECDANRDWSCVGHVSSPASVADAAAVTLRIVDVFKLNTGRPGVTVKLCQSNDPSCSQPKDTQTTDSDGVATVIQPLNVGGTGPTGYLDLENDAGFYRELFFWSFPLSQPTVSFGVFSATNDEVNFAASVYLPDGGLDANRGSVFFYAQDCRTISAADVQFALEPSDSETRFFYLHNGALSSTADRTDTGGLAAAFNVPKGVVTVTATPVGHASPSGAVSFYVLPQTLSYVLVPPTP